MTVKTKIECDGLDCSDEIYVDDSDDVDTTLRYSGWVEDGYYHYCKSCSSDTRTIDPFMEM
jgi:hypothetical protein